MLIQPVGPGDDDSSVVPGDRSGGAKDPALRDLSGKFVSKFKFSEIGEYHDGDVDGVSSEIGHALQTIQDIALRSGLARDRVQAVMTGVLNMHSEGADLDHEYGASMTGVSHEVLKTIIEEIESRYGQTVGNMVSEMIELSPFFNTAERDDLSFASDMLKALNEKKLVLPEDPEVLKAAFEHAKEMTPAGDEFNMREFLKAIDVVRDGGIAALKKYQKKIGWEA